MQELTQDGVPVSKLSTNEIEEVLEHINEIELNDTDGMTDPEARETIRRRLELEIRIRNMGLSS